MTKKPIQIYLIAVWAFLQVPILGSFFLSLQDTYNSIIRIVVFSAVAFLVFNLVKLRNIARLITIIALATEAFARVIVMFYMLNIREDLFPLQYLALTMPTISLLCIWYLTRQKTRNLFIETVPQEDTEGTNASKDSLQASNKAL